MSRWWAGPALFAAWTILVWSTRVRNVLADADVDGGARAVALTRAALLVLLGLVVAVAAVRAWRTGRPEPWGRVAVWVLAAVTVVVWAVSVVDITFDAGHGAGFKVVHGALAAVSVALAVVAVRAWPPRRGPGAGQEGLTPPGGRRAGAGTTRR